MRFSQVRPLVFAVGSVDGLLYLFDLEMSTAAPVATLELPSPDDISTNASKSSGGDKPAPASIGARRAQLRRSGVIGIAFNKKQRDLIAACDADGLVHVWKLSWKLANRHQNEQAILDGIAARNAQ